MYQDQDSSRVGYGVFSETTQSLDAENRGDPRVLAGPVPILLSKAPIEAFGNSTTLASAARFLCAYLRYEVEPASVPDWRSWSKITITSDEIASVVHQHPLLVGDVTWAMTNRQQRGGLVPAAVAAFRYLARRGWPDKETTLDMFLDAAVLHFGLTRDHPAQAVRRWVERTGSGTARSYRREAQVYVLLYGWRAFVSERSIWGINDRLAAPFPSAHRSLPDTCAQVSNAD